MLGGKRNDGRAGVLKLVVKRGLKPNCWKVGGVKLESGWS